MFTSEASSTLKPQGKQPANCKRHKSFQVARFDFVSDGSWNTFVKFQTEGNHSRDNKWPGCLILLAYIFTILSPRELLLRLSFH